MRRFVRLLVAGMLTATNPASGQISSIDSLENILVDSRDNAMYRAKEEGKNRIVVTRGGRETELWSLF